MRQLLLRDDGIGAVQVIPARVPVAKVPRGERLLFVVRIGLGLSKCASWFPR